MCSDRQRPFPPDRMRAGMSHITRRRFFAQAGKVALGFFRRLEPASRGVRTARPDPSRSDPSGTVGLRPCAVSDHGDQGLPGAVQPATHAGAGCEGPPAFGVVRPTARDEPATGGVRIRSCPALRGRRDPALEPT